MARHETRWAFVSGRDTRKYGLSIWRLARRSMLNHLRRVARDEGQEIRGMRFKVKPSKAFPRYYLMEVEVTLEAAK